MKAGARGLFILFASGDQGVCGREVCGWFSMKFHPDFPAASPYITAVGGTDFLTNGIGEETAWPEGGGGFSNTFSPPDYQKAAVHGYLSNPNAKPPPSSMWNASGRGYPDVAALGGMKVPFCIPPQDAFHCSQKSQGNTAVFLAFRHSFGRAHGGELLQFPRLARKKHQRLTSGSGTWPTIAA